MLLLSTNNNRGCSRQKRGHEAMTGLGSLTNLFELEIAEIVELTEFGFRLFGFFSCRVEGASGNFELPIPCIETH